MLAWQRCCCSDEAKASQQPLSVDIMVRSVEDGRVNAAATDHRSGIVLTPSYPSSAINGKSNGFGNRPHVAPRFDGPSAFEVPAGVQPTGVFCCDAAQQGAIVIDIVDEPDENLPISYITKRPSRLSRLRMGMSVDFKDIFREPTDLKVGEVNFDEGVAPCLTLVTSEVDDRIVVSVIKEGPWAEWNRVADDPGWSNVRLQPGDRILDVNGVSDGVVSIIAELTAQRSSARMVFMYIRRPKKNVVVVERTVGSNLGMAIRDVGDQLFVRQIEEGLIDDWNVTFPDRRVRETDRIVEVNGVNGSPAELAEILREENITLEIVFDTHPD